MIVKVCQEVEGHHMTLSQISGLKVGTEWERVAEKVTLASTPNPFSLFGGELVGLRAYCYDWICNSKFGVKP